MFRFAIYSEAVELNAFSLDWDVCLKNLFYLAGVSHEHSQGHPFRLFSSFRVHGAYRAPTRVLSFRRNARQLVPGHARTKCSYSTQNQCFKSTLDKAGSYQCMCILLFYFFPFRLVSFLEQQTITQWKLSYTLTVIPATST